MTSVVTDVVVQDLWNQAVSVVTDVVQDLSFGDQVMTIVSIVGQMW